jgi:hypothetical protein
MTGRLGGEEGGTGVTAGTAVRGGDLGSTVA